jgi:proline dehydrogenase
MSTGGRKGKACQSNMGPLNRVIANSVPFMPKSLIGRVGRRYAAGEELEDAVRVVEGLSKEGCLATVGMLGEHAPDERHTRGRLDEYRQALDALEKQGFKGYRVAVKLTDLGLTLDRELCRKNLEEILLYARERARFLEVDMEESPFVSDTLDMVLDMHERHGNTGAVVQAYLRRTLEDVQRLVEARIPVRLVKGVYVESREVAYRDYDIIRENYVLLLEELLRGGIYVGIATHDEYLTWHALRLIHRMGLTKDQYEFQMIMGVQEELRRILVEAGHRVRVTVLFGKDWYEYSLRRLKENPKIAGYVTRDVLGSLAQFAGPRSAFEGWPRRI